MKKDDFDAWAIEQGKTGKPPAWKSWPPKAREEINRALKLNDEGRANISVRAMVVRLRTTHQLANASQDTLRAYLEQSLKRAWRRK